MGKAKKAVCAICFSGVILFGMGTEIKDELD